MHFSFILSDIKPFSVNNMYYKDGRQRTQAYYDWSFNFFSRLNHPDIQAGLEPLRSTFDPNKHAYIIKLTASFPKETYFTRKGQISARTMDLSNWEKPLLDCLMLPKHHTNTPPYGAPNLNCDDRYVISLTSRKLWTASEQPSLRISIRMVDFIEPEQNPHLK